MKKNQGFTLIETAIVLVFFGLFAGLFVKSYIDYQNEQRSEITTDHIDQSRNAVNNFMNATGRYPCPARLSAGPDDADYGVEDCTGALLDADPNAAANSDFVDLDGDGIGEKVMAGAIPFNTIEDTLGQIDDDMVAGGYAPIFGRLDDQSVEKMSLDGYNNKLTYIVTMHGADRPIHLQ